MKSLVGALSASAVLVLFSAAPPAPDPPARKTQDPNERICEKISIIGSRLAVKRVCLTRAEWAEKRKLDRDAVEQAQRSPCVIGSYSAGDAQCGSQ